MQSQILCDFWIDQKPQPLPRPRTSFLYRDEGGKNRQWNMNDTVPRLRKDIVPMTHTPDKNVGMRSLVPGLALQSRNARRIWAPHKGPVLLRVFCMFAPNVSDTKKVTADKMAGLVPMLKHPDGDNVLKNVADGLEDVIFDNDKQIIDAQAFKGYGPVTGVRVLAMDVNMTEWAAHVLSLFPNGINPPFKVAPGPLFGGAEA